MAKVTQSKRDQMAERRQHVANLRLAHYTQQEIANELGLSVTTVCRDLQALRAEWQERRSMAFDGWVAEELAKLDALERAILPQALQGKPGAAERVLKIMDRRARMLGLDKPQQHEHTVITQDALDAEIARLEAELAER